MPNAFIGIDVMVGASETNSNTLKKHEVFPHSWTSQLHVFTYSERVGSQKVGRILILFAMNVNGAVLYLHALLNKTKAFTTVKKAKLPPFYGKPPNATT